MGVAVVMLVVAMLVMVMVAIMVMMVVMVMTVVMVMPGIAMMMRVIVVMIVRVVMTGMAMAMIVRGVRGRIGAAFGIERRLDLDDARAQPLHHLLDHVIPPDAQTLAHDLRWKMAVAEMPGDPHQMLRIGPPDLDQWLRRGYHFDQPAVLQHQRIAAAQGHRVFEVEQKFQPARPRHRHPPPVPVVKVKDHRIGGRFRPAILPSNLRRPNHV